MQVSIWMHKLVFTLFAYAKAVSITDVGGCVWGNVIIMGQWIYVLLLPCLIWPAVSTKDFHDKISWWSVSISLWNKHSLLHFLAHWKYSRNFSLFCSKMSLWMMILVQAMCAKSLHDYLFKFMIFLLFNTTEKKNVFFVICLIKM